MDVPDSKYVVEAALHPAGGDWAPAVKLSRGERNAWEPSVAMDGAGNATAAWYSPDDKNNTIVQSATMKAGTPWDEPIDLSDPGADSFYPRVGGGGRGAVVLWEREGVIQAAALVDGDWQEPTDLSSSASKEVSVDLDSQGNATHRVENAGHPQPWSDQGQDNDSRRPMVARAGWTYRPPR